jgi:hypothetical protein
MLSWTNWHDRLIRMPMAIEFTQIHNVVRTYQRAIHLPPSERQDAQQTGHVGQDQISISPGTRERNATQVIDDVISVTSQ